MESTESSVYGTLARTLSPPYLGIFILALQDVEWYTNLHPKQKQDWSHCIIDEALAYVRDTSRYDKNCGYLPNLDPASPLMPLSDKGSYLHREQLYFPFKWPQLIQFLWDVHHRTHHPGGALLTKDKRLVAGKEYISRRGVKWWRIQHWSPTLF